MDHLVKYSTEDLSFILGTHVQKRKSWAWLSGHTPVIPALEMWRQELGLDSQSSLLGVLQASERPSQRRLTAIPSLSSGLCT